MKEKQYDILIQKLTKLDKIHYEKLIELLKDEKRKYLREILSLY